MSKFNYLAASGVAVVLSTVLSTSALAWHPEGKITKEVQNVTTKSAYADANDARSAIVARPGDVLSYRITVVNPAPKADKQWNDLTKIKVTDVLPSGVTLVSGSKDKDFGSTVVVPQGTSGNGTKSVSYVFTAKVAGTVADKTVLCNTAKFTGNSLNNDAPRSGEDKACVTVIVPVTPKPETPKTPEKPQTPETPATPVVQAEAPKAPASLPAEIPHTGAGSALASMTGLGALTYLAGVLVQSRRK